MNDSGLAPTGKYEVSGAIDHARPTRSIAESMDGGKPLSMIKATVVPTVVPTRAA